MAGIRPVWPEPARLVAGIWLTGFRRRWPDSGDINRMLSDSDTGNISMVVGYLNVKVNCVV
jgi:hypothetical protein